jgi:hypothetical protein
MAVSDANGDDLVVVQGRDRRSCGLLARRLTGGRSSPSARAAPAPRAARVQAEAPRSGVGAQRRAWTRASTAPNSLAEGEDRR